MPTLTLNPNDTSGIDRHGRTWRAFFHTCTQPWEYFTCCSCGERMSWGWYCHDTDGQELWCNNCVDIAN